MKNDQFGPKSVTLEEIFFQTNTEEFAVERHRLAVLANDHTLFNSVLNIADEKVLNELMQLEITPATLMAFSLFPSIHVAWADGKLESSEKDAILKSAEQLGFASDSSAFKLLEFWLCREPSAELLHAWKTFVQELAPSLTNAAFQDLKSAAMKRAMSISYTAGGFLGFNKTSKVEKSAISELESIFDRALPEKPGASKS